jgi:hypothetical protein
MKVVKIAFIVVAAIVLPVSAWLGYAGHHPPTAVPKASISLIGYTNWSNFDPNTNDLVYPYRGSWLIAKMLFTNEGNISIVYTESYGWATAQTDKGLTNGYLPMYFTGEGGVLLPRSSDTFSVGLPTNTLQWKCCLIIRAAGMQEITRERMDESKMYRYLPILYYPVQYLPGICGPEINLMSPTIVITNVPGLLRDTAMEPTNFPD